MEDWQTRVVQERDELNLKLTKLSAFVDSKTPPFETLEFADKILLRRQRRVMKEYILILNARITRF